MAECTVISDSVRVVLELSVNEAAVLHNILHHVVGSTLGPRQYALSVWDALEKASLSEPSILVKSDRTAAFCETPSLSISYRSGSIG
jgi:hypothetical protein